MTPKAMLFAAGLGTRLAPLTNDRPKALVEINGKTLLEHTISHLKKFGIIDIVVNIHHFGEKVLEVLEQHQNFDCNIIISDERNALLETGGGLKKAADFLRGDLPIVLYNVDVLSNIDLKKMIKHHLRHQALATLATRKRPSSRNLIFNEKLELCGWSDAKKNEKKIVRLVEKTQDLAFSGIHVISPQLLDLIQKEGKFSITDTYLDLAGNQKIIAYPHDEDYWFDVGKPEKLEEAKRFLMDNGEWIIRK